MSKNLVIVESPAKAKTIEGYLGKDYKVVSSYGHVRDLPKDDMAIDVKNGFKPTYEVSKDKKEVIKNLKKDVKSSEMIFLASDDDREGEAISWHLYELLKEDGYLEGKTVHRIAFNEITKRALKEAVDSPRCPPSRRRSAGPRCARRPRRPPCPVRRRSRARHLRDRRWHG